MTRSTVKLLLPAACMFLIFSAAAQDTTRSVTPHQNTRHQKDQPHAAHIMLNDGSLKWTAGPPFLPPGVMLAVLQGDPSKEGPFTVRLNMPAHYRIPPHTHPAIEHVTIIEGNIHMGTGTTFSESATTQLRKGGYAVMPAGLPHYVFTKSKAIVQVHGMGPFTITYSNPAEDPRNKKQ